MYGGFASAPKWRRPEPVQHLYNPIDWKKNTKRIKAGLDPLYGKITEEDYLKAFSWVNALPSDTVVNSFLLKRIHELACQRTFFQGFEIRRIRDQIKKGRIDPKKYKSLEQRIYKHHQALSGFDHRTLAGAFRSMPEDQIPFSRFDTAADTLPKFDRKKWELVRASPYLEVRKIDRSLPDGSVYALVNYTSPERVAAEVDAVLAQVEGSLDQVKTIDEKVRAIVQMERDLISIHPFHDGNGRSIRLLRDLLYRRIGLPPPLHSFDKDLDISLEELIEIERAEMVRFLQARSNTKPFARKTGLLLPSIG